LPLCYIREPCQPAVEALPVSLYTAAGVVTPAIMATNILFKRWRVCSEP